MIVALLELSRPKHWVKNVFVLLPVPFALASGAALNPRAFGIGLLAICLAASGVYALNDAFDAERDRAHESKKKRPVASGRVTRNTALMWGVTLFILSVALTIGISNQIALQLIGVYIVVNLIYSAGAKNVALLDVFLLSSLYIVRVLLGCALLGVQASNWLLLCSYALALFLALAKRRGDVVKGLDENHRPALSGYNQAFLDQAMAITACMTIVAYALYSMEAVVLIPGREFAALPFVVFGVLDYLRMAHVHKAGDSPVDMLLRSPALLLSGAGWLAATLWSIRF